MGFAACVKVLIAMMGTREKTMSRKALLTGFAIVALGLIVAGVGLTCLQQTAPGTDATSTSNAVGSSRLDILARLPSPTNSLTSNRPTTSTAPWKGRTGPGLSSSTSRRSPSSGRGFTDPFS